MVTLVSSILSANFCIGGGLYGGQIGAGPSLGRGRGLIMGAEMTRGFDLDQVKAAATAHFWRMFPRRLL